MSLTKKETVEEYLKDFTLTSENPSVSDDGAQNATLVEQVHIGKVSLPRYVNEFWTSRQRQASSIHEVSYRACFKPQLPGFFIGLLTSPGDKVYDPFSGRGTTVVEAALRGREAVASDVNPLSRLFTRPRLEVPSIEELSRRLSEITFDYSLGAGLDLSMFYHRATEAEIVSLRRYLQKRWEKGREDEVDRWIRMVATNRLTGHSPGFFSVYTLPPNQAVSRERQVKINKKRNLIPPYRDIRQLILKKSRSLLRGLSREDLSNLRKCSETALLLESDSRNTPEIPSETIQLTVTSPPFLDVVQYSRDNWLRCWFNMIDPVEIEKKLTQAVTVKEWSLVMGETFKELYRITRPGGWVAFEVGEVKNSSINLDEYVVPLGLEAGFTCVGVLVNLQEFTKTSNIWGINNNRFGTNTNRVVLFLK